MRVKIAGENNQQKLVFSFFENYVLTLAGLNNFQLKNLEH